MTDATVPGWVDRFGEPDEPPWVNGHADGAEVPVPDDNVHLVNETLSPEPDAPSGRNLSERFTSPVELAATLPPAIEWAWLTFLAFGAIAELVGAAKAAGKTTFLAHLIAAILDGRAFLDQSTTRGPVVLLTEQPATSLRAVLERSGLASRTDLRILLWRDTRGARWSEIVAAAVAECQRIGARVLIIDTLPAFAGIRGDAENDAGSALAAIEPLQVAAADGLAVLVVRHERKGGGEVGESGRGSSAFTGAVDVVLRLARQPNSARPTIRVLSALSRFDETPPEIVLDLTDHGYIALGDQTAVAFMAPQLKALNLTVDDGIGLLNLFASSGLDAAAGQKALNAAITNLPAGESLTQFLARLSRITDGGARAQEAMKVFGVRAGAGLANAIRPGVDSIDGFKVSLDEATGATVKAADVLDSTFSAQVQLKIKAVGAAIRDIGPGITGVASAVSLLGTFGSTLKLDTVFSKAFGALKTSGPVTAAISVAGGVAGTIYGVAAGATEKLVGPIMGAWASVGGSGAVLAEARAAGGLAGGAYGVAFSAAIVVGLAMIASQIAGPINKAGRDLHDIIFSKDGPLGFLKDPLEGAGQWLDSLPWPLGPVGAPDWAGGQSQVDAGMKGITVSTGKMADDVVSLAEKVVPALDTVDAKFRLTAADIVGNLGTIAGGVVAANISVADLAKHFGTSMGGVVSASRVTGREGMLAMAAGITAARSAPLDAFDTLKSMLKDAMTRTGEQARLAGELTSKELAAGLRSNDPAVRAQAIATREAILDRFRALTASSNSIGAKAMSELAAGLKSKDPEIRAAAKAALTAAYAQLTKFAVAGGPAGKAAMAELDKGIRSKIPAVHDAALAAKTAALAQLNATKVPAGAAGAAAGAAFAAKLGAAAAGALTKLSSSLGYVGNQDIYKKPVGRAAGGPTEADKIYLVGEHGTELWKSGGTGYVTPADMSAALMKTAQRPSVAAAAAPRFDRPSAVAAMAGGSMRPADVAAIIAAAIGGSGTTNTTTYGPTAITVALPTTAHPDPFEVASQLRRLNDFGVLSIPSPR